MFGALTFQSLVFTSLLAALALAALLYTGSWQNQGEVDVMLLSPPQQASPVGIGTTPGPEARSVALAPGWNLVGWAGAATPLPEATAAIAGRFDQLLTYDAREQRFRTYAPEAPLAGAAATLAFGDAVWINITDSNGVVWSLPGIAEMPAIALRPGWNLVTWTGPDGTQTVDALSAISPQVETLLHYDTETQTFLRFTPDLPVGNAATTLDLGDALWVRLTGEVIWDQSSVAGGSQNEGPTSE